MAKASRQDFDWQDAANGQAAMMASLNGAVVQALAKSTQNYVDSVATLTREMADFMGARLRSDVQFGQSMSKCKDWSAMASLQQDWAREANQAYTAEAQRLSELSAKMMRDGSAPLFAGLERATNGGSKAQGS